jgi:hypothetical protein
VTFLVDDVREVDEDAAAMFSVPGAEVELPKLELGP